MEKNLNLPIHEALEPVLRIMFRGDTGILWIDDPDKQQLYAPSQRIFGSYNNSMPGFVFKTQSVIQIKDASAAPAGFTVDPRLGSATSPMFFFPIANRGVIQIIRRSSGSFQDVDMEAAQLLMHKFSVYGQSIFSSSDLTPVALKLFTGIPETTNPIKILCNYFGSETAEIWRIDPERGLSAHYDLDAQDMSAADPPAAVSEAVREMHSVNEAGERPLIASHLDRGRREHWSVLVAGRPQPFNTSEEAQLNAITPFVARFITGFGNQSEQNQFVARLGDLLNMFSMVAFATTAEQLQRIVVEQGAALLDCEAVKLHFFSKKAPRPEIGISRIAAEKGTAFAMAAPAENDEYIGDVDSVPGVDPTSVLFAPIKDAAGNVKGMLYGLSKRGRPNFDQSDVKIAESIASYTRAAMDHSRRLKKLESLNEAVAKNAPVAVLLHKMFVASDTARLCLYRARPELALVCEEGLPVDEDEERAAAAKLESHGTVKFYRLVGAAMDDVGVLGVSGSLPNLQACALILAKRLDEPVGDATELGDVIDSREAASSKAYMKIDLGDRIFKPEFDMERASTCDLYKMVFKVFGRLGLFETCAVSNICLFTFLKKLGITRRCVSTLQYMAYELITTHLDRRLTKQTVLCLFIASLLSDFTSESKCRLESSEAADRVLDCINVMASDETSLFRALPLNDCKNCWAEIVELVIATDYARYFETINSAIAAHQSDENDDADVDETPQPILALMLLCAKIGDLTRPKVKKATAVKIATAFWRRADPDMMGEKELISFYDGPASKAFDALGQIHIQLDLCSTMLRESKERIL